MYRLLLCCAVVLLLIPVQSFSQTGFSPDDYASFRKSVKDLSVDDIMSRHKPAAQYYSGRIPLSLAGVAWFDSAVIKLELTDDEIAMIEKNGFMVSERLSNVLPGYAFHWIYGKDLPVFISTDAVLQSVHLSYDRILMRLEQDILEPNLQEITRRMYDVFPVLAEKYNGDEAMRRSIRDVDLYLTIVRSLITGTDVATRFAGADEYDVVKAAIASEKMIEMPLFTENERKLDFSQFIVRGHYLDPPGKELQHYFRAMMWLGRMDFHLTQTPDYGSAGLSEDDFRRMCIDTALLNELIDAAGADELLAENERIIGFMVGESDNLTPDEFADVFDEQGIDGADALFDDAVYKGLIEALTAAGNGGQRILSNFFIMDPYASEPDVLPISYRLMGQRFIVDSFVFSNVVYDRIVHDGQKVWRPMPDPLDAMYALGNDDALPLLEDELRTYKYAEQLESLRYLIDAYDASFWEETLYNGWLGAIRALNPPSDDAGLPFFMKTTAWHQEKLNTQLASWAQLRHDTLLYAKQSYTGGTVCSFPHSYVEPYPEFYRRIVAFAGRGLSHVESYGERSPYIGMAVTYFTNLADIAGRLEILAQKQLDGVSFSADEEKWLKEMLFVETGSGAPPFSGWFADLYYNAEQNHLIYDDDYDFVVADVHTQPTDASGGVVGRVLHVGTGLINLGVFIAPSPSNGFAPMAYAGPVMSYYEMITDDFKRMNDRDWFKIVREHNVPERPDWVNSWLVDQKGAARKEGRELPGVLYADVGVEDDETGRPRVFPTIAAHPNPFNPSTTISYTVPRAGSVNVEVFDILGRKIAVLADGVHKAGMYDAVWEASDHASGVYVCRVSAGGTERSIRMTLVR